MNNIEYNKGLFMYLSSNLNLESEKPLIFTGSYDKLIFVLEKLKKTGNIKIEEGETSNKISRSKVFIVKIGNTIILLKENRFLTGLDNVKKNLYKLIK